jgi:hypothetical protein
MPATPELLFDGQGGVEQIRLALHQGLDLGFQGERPDRCRPLDEASFDHLIEFALASCGLALTLLSRIVEHTDAPSRVLGSTSSWPRTRDGGSICMGWASVALGK